MTPAESRRAVVLSKLAARPMITVEQLAADLNVSERTIYRDLQRLRGPGAADVARRARTSYYVREADSAPPIYLSVDERAAAAAGAELVARWGAPELADAARRLLRRLRPSGVEQALDRCTSNIAILRDALRQHRQVRFLYTDLTGDERAVSGSPRSLIFRGDHWSLLAWDHLRDEYRSFRPEHISALNLTTEPAHVPTELTDDDEGLVDLGVDVGDVKDRAEVIW